MLNITTLLNITLFRHLCVWTFYAPTLLTKMHQNVFKSFDILINDSQALQGGIAENNKQQHQKFVVGKLRFTASLKANLLYHMVVLKTVHGRTCCLGKCSLYLSTTVVLPR